jgi:hypothetical protein
MAMEIRGVMEVIMEEDVKVMTLPFSNDDYTKSKFRIHDEEKTPEKDADLRWSFDQMHQWKSDRKGAPCIGRQPQQGSGRRI